MLFTNRTDAAAGTNGSYSVSLPADGSCIIWFDDATRTKLVIKDSTAAVIPNGTIDNISGEFDYLSSTLTVAAETISTGPLLMSSGLIEAAKGANIASATTTDLSAATGNFVTITGTTTITGFGTLPAGTEMVLTFSGILTLTYNATSMIIPGAASITTFAGQTMKVLSLGSGNWQILSTGHFVIPDNNNLNRAASIASATTTDLATVTGTYVTVTGNATITALGTLPSGVIKYLLFTGGAAATHNAASLILLGATNVAVYPGNTVSAFVSLGSGNWKEISRTYPSTVTTDLYPLIAASGDTTKMLALSCTGLTASTTRTWTVPDMNVACFVVQRVSTQTGAVATGTTAIPHDDTPPQNTEGDQYLSLAITPKSASSILVIESQLDLSNSNANMQNIIALFQDATANALSAAECFQTVAVAQQKSILRHTMTSGTTSNTTFKIRAGSATGATTTLNGTTGTRSLGGVMNSFLTITEYST